MPGGLVGREAERRQLVRALERGRPVLVEGPPGVGKATLLRAVAAAQDRPLFVVDGGAALTPAALVGGFSPERVLAHGWRDADFAPGPLVAAMRAGGLLCLRGLGHASPDVLNVLLEPLSGGTLAVARLGAVTAAPGFGFVGTTTGTATLSTALADRVVRVVLGHGPPGHERAVVAAHAGPEPGWLAAGAARLVRATRAHPDLRRGASVRAAVDFAVVTRRLAALRGVDLDERTPARFATVLDAALVTIPGRTAIAPGAPRTEEDVVAELVEDVFLLAPGAAGEGSTIDVASTITRTVPSEPAGPARVVPVAPRETVPEHVAWPKPGRPTEEPRLVAAEPAAPAAVAPAAGAGGTAPERGAGDAVAPAQDAVAGEDPGAGGADDAGEQGRFGDRHGGGTSSWRGLVERLALELVLPRPPRVEARRRGHGPLRTMPFAGDATEIDLERTVDALVGNPLPTSADVWVRQHARGRRAFVLLLDLSGSMQGEQLACAALAACALQQAARHEELAIVAFWRDAVILQEMGARTSPDALVQQLATIRSGGLTNLHWGLEVGLAELERATSDEGVGVLVSDGGHNLGPDPRELAAHYPALHVLATSSAPSRTQACRELSELGNGRWAVAEALDQVVPAMDYCLSP